MSLPTRILLVTLLRTARYGLAAIEKWMLASGVSEEEIRNAPGPPKTALLNGQ